MISFIPPPTKGAGTFALLLLYLSALCASLLANFIVLTNWQWQYSDYILITICSGWTLLCIYGIYLLREINKNLYKEIK